MHAASRWTTPARAAPRVPLLQRRITIPTSDQTPVPGPALHAHPHQPQTSHARLPLLGLPSGQTPVRGLPLLILGQQELYFNSTGGAHTGAIASEDVGSPATSPNSNAPLDTPHSVPAAGVHTPPRNPTNEIIFSTNYQTSSERTQTPCQLCTDARDGNNARERIYLMHKPLQSKKENILRHSN